MKLFRVHWKSLRTDKTGQSDGAWPESSAQAWADELNARPENKQSRFWVEPAGLQAQPESRRVA